MVLNSVEYGVPQIRKRVILIGVRKDIKLEPEEIYNNIIKTHYIPEANDIEKKGKLKFVSVKEAIGDLPAIKQVGALNILNL